MDIERCVLGVDFGTDSVRALVVNATDGGEISAGTAPFPRWRDGRFCEPASNRFRQHPRDVQLLPQMQADVAGGRIAASTAARNLLLAHAHQAQAAIK